MARGVGLSGPKDLNPGISVDIDELVMLCFGLFVVDFVASLDRCSRVVVNRNELVMSGRAKQDLPEHAGAVVDWHFTGSVTQREDSRSGAGRFVLAGSPFHWYSSEPLEGQCWDAA